MRSKALALLTVMPVVAVLGGCGSSGDAADSINLWLPPFVEEGELSDQEQWATIVGPFEEEHDVDVNVTIVPWSNYEERYLTGVSGGDGPHLGYMYTEMMGDYISRDLLVDLDPYLSDEQRSEYLYLDQGRHDGVQYALPFVVGGARVLYYNQDVLTASGVTELPQTWDQFLAASELVADAGFVPTTQAWGAPDRAMLNETFFPLLWQAGGSIFNDDGTATAFDDEAGIAAAEFLNTLYTQGHMPSTATGMDAGDTREPFLQGEVAFWPGSDVWFPTFTEAGLNFGFIDSLENTEQATFVAADSLVMLNGCPEPELCADLMEFLLDGEQMTQFHTFAHYPPVASDEEYTADPAFEELYGQNEILRNLPIAAGGVATYNALFSNLQQMLLGEKTPEQALADAAAEGDAALGNAGS